MEMRKTKKNYIKQWVHLSNYTDQTLLTNNEDDLQWHVTEVNVILTSYNMKILTMKIKMMMIEGHEKISKN